MLGHKACFTGKAAGWTLKRLAGRACYSGHYFNALNAREAFLIYGFPSFSDLLLGSPPLSLFTGLRLSKFWLTGTRGCIRLSEISKRDTKREIEFKEECKIGVDMIIEYRSIATQIQSRPPPITNTTHRIFKLQR